MSRALINAATAAAVTAHAPVVPKIVGIPRGSDPNFSATPLIFYRVVLRRTSSRSFVKRVCTVTPRGVMYLCTSDARATRSCFLGHATRVLIDAATLTIEMRDASATTTVNFSLCDDSANPSCTLRMLVNIVRFFSPGVAVCDADDSDDDALSSNAGAAQAARPKSPNLHQDVAHVLGGDQHERTKNVFAGLGGLRAHVLAVEAGIEDDHAEEIADAHRHHHQRFVDGDGLTSTDGDVNANFKPPVALKLPSLFDDDADAGEAGEAGADVQAMDARAVAQKDTSHIADSSNGGGRRRRGNSDPATAFSDVGRSPNAPSVPFAEASPIIPQRPSAKNVAAVAAAAEEEERPKPQFLEITPALAATLAQHAAALKKPPAPLQQRARVLGSVTSPEEHHAMMRFALVAYVAAAGTPGAGDTAGTGAALEALMLTVNHTGVAHVWRGKDAVTTFDATERTRKLHVRTESEAVLTLVLPGVAGNRPVAWSFTVRAPRQQGFGGGAGAQDKTAADVMRRVVATLAALNTATLSVQIDQPPAQPEFGSVVAGDGRPTKEQRLRLDELRREREAAEERARLQAEAAEREREAQAQQLAAMLRPSPQAEQRMVELRRLVSEAKSDAEEAARLSQLEAASDAMRQSEARQTALGCLVGMICDRQRRALHEARMQDLTARSRISVGRSASSRDGISASPVHRQPSPGHGR